jgi:uncharacterized membrane protein
MADGSISVVWLNMGYNDLYLIRVSSSGAVLSWSRLLISNLSGMQQPYAVAGPDNLLLVAYSANGSGSSEIFVTGFNVSSFAQTYNVVRLANDSFAASEPYAILGLDGELWVTWINHSTVFYPGDIMFSRLTTRRSSLALHTALETVEVSRGGVALVNFTVVNNGTAHVEVLVSSWFAPLVGPTNWSVEGTDSSGEPLPPSVQIGAGEAASLYFRVVPPVADPVGYIGRLWLGASEAGWALTSLNLSVDFLVVQGHRFEMSPRYAEVTALPGESAGFAFLLRDTGWFDETIRLDGLLVVPPPSWPVRFSANAVPLAPGEEATLWANMSVPANATWNERVCGSFGVSIPTDPFVNASAGFCVVVALVATPALAFDVPSVEIPPGGSASVVLSLTNVGNAREPVECRLDTVQAFPAGWYSMGLPAVIPLEGGETGEVQVDFLAPTGALGNERVDVVVEAACPEGGSTGRANFSLVVEAVHAVKWAVQGDALQANETGWATFAVTIENLGNVPEPFSWQPLEFPMGWSVSAIPAGMDPSAAVFPAFSTASVRVEIHAGESSLAGTYIVDISLVAGQEPPFRRTFHVTLPVRHDLTGRFLASSSVVGPGEDLTITGEVANPGNADDTYSLVASTDGAWGWGWKAEFVGEQGSGQLVGTQLILKAFGRGTLTVTFTVPGSPFPGLVEVSVGLSSPHVATVGASFSVAVELSDLLARWASIPNGTANPTLSGNATLQVEFLRMRAPATVAVEVFLDGDRVWNDSLHVPAGTGVLNVSVPLVLGAGEHRLEARVDPRDSRGGDPRWGVLFESDETNNDAVAALAIGSPPTSPGGGDERPPAENAAMGGATFVLASILGGVVAAAVGIVVWRRRAGRRRAGDGGTLQHHAEVGDEKDPTRRD